jgi:broad specificity phosphatase PhoE
MVRLILIRHALTDYNLQNRYCGACDPPLNNKGIRQAERIAQCLRGLHIDKVYSSDLRRAYQTAQIIFKNNLIQKSADFREMNFGIFEGLRYEEILKRFPSIYSDWIKDPLGVRIPKGEGLNGLSERVKKRLSFILSQCKSDSCVRKQDKAKTIAIVTHGGPIRIILCDALKYDLALFWQITQDVGALNVIDYSEDRNPLIVKINDTSHLKGARL